jgi:hypothetical protein
MEDLKIQADKKFIAECMELELYYVKMGWT